MASEAVSDEDDVPEQHRASSHRRSSHTTRASVQPFSWHDTTNSPRPIARLRQSSVSDHCSRLLFIPRPRFHLGNSRPAASITAIAVKHILGVKEFPTAFVDIDDPFEWILSQNAFYPPSIILDSFRIDGEAALRVGFP
jgi:hypothetical protein